MKSILTCLAVDLLWDFRKELMCPKTWTEHSKDQLTWPLASECSHDSGSLLRNLGHGPWRETKCVKVTTSSSKAWESLFPRWWCKVQHLQKTTARALGEPRKCYKHTHTHTRTIQGKTGNKKPQHNQINSETIGFIQMNQTWSHFEIPDGVLTTTKCQRSFREQSKNFKTLISFQNIISKL